MAGLLLLPWLLGSATSAAGSVARAGVPPGIIGTLRHQASVFPLLDNRHDMTRTLSPVLPGARDEQRAAPAAKRNTDVAPHAGARSSFGFCVFASPGRS